MRIASEERKSEYPPKILTGDIEFAIGYTKPDAGGRQDLRFTGGPAQARRGTPADPHSGTGAERTRQSSCPEKNQLTRDYP